MVRARLHTCTLYICRPLYARILHLRFYLHAYRHLDRCTDTRGQAAADASWRASAGIVPLLQMLAQHFPNLSLPVIDIFLQALQGFGFKVFQGNEGMEKWRTSYNHGGVHRGYTTKMTDPWLTCQLRAPISRKESEKHLHLSMIVGSW